MSAAPPSVLVVDDNEELAENIAEILSDVGVKVTVARDAASALAAFDECEWSLVVTDVRMPKIDGLELLTMLKERRPSTPILVMTGFADPDTVARAQRSGAFAVVHKPVDLDDLIGLIERISDARIPVLIVEDDVGLCSNLIEILAEQRGLLPHPATTVALARRLAAQIDFGMVVLDLRLPDGDGVSLAHELRHRADGSLRPMILMTGYPEEIARTQDCDDDQVLVLTKPFAVPRLVERLRELVANESP
ncbi:response regulator [Nannocystaceae bacterium ST9]